MDLWRISEFASLDGEGGRLANGRWNSAGNSVVYLAASPPGALIEVLVHLELDDDDFPPKYTLLHIVAADSLPIHTIRVPAGASWKTDLPLTRKLGDAWLKSRRSALARVPSAIIPNTFNYLLNPRHTDAARMRIAKSIPAVYDPRLLRQSPGAKSY